MEPISVDIDKLMPGSPNGLLKQYMAIPEDQRGAFLESLTWYKNLPDNRKYKCKYCKDNGWIYDKDGRVRPCKCSVGLDEETDKIVLTSEYIALDHLMKEYGWENWPLPDMETLTSHKDFVYTLSIQKAQWMIASMVDGGQGTGLILCGANGRGKTLSGLLVLRQAALLKKKCFAIRFGEIIQLIKQGLDGSKKKFRIMDYLFDADAVLVDEVGKESSGGNQDHGKQLAEEIIDHFHRHKKTLVMTSNLNKKMLNEYFTASTVSRIGTKAGWCTVVEEPKANDLRGTGILK